MAKQPDKMKPLFIFVILISIILLTCVYWHWNRYGRVLESFQDPPATTDATAPSTGTTTDATAATTTTATTATPTNTSSSTTTTTSTTTTVTEPVKSTTCIPGGTLSNYADLSACVQTVWKQRCNRDISGFELNNIMGGLQGKLDNNSTYPFNDLSASIYRMDCDKSGMYPYMMRLKEAGNDPSKFPKIKDPVSDLGMKPDDKVKYYKKLESYKSRHEPFTGTMDVATDTIIASINKIPLFNIRESMQVHAGRKDNSEYDIPQVTEKFVSSGLDSTIYTNNTKKNYAVQSPLTTFELR
jgi:hypothetical protein